MTDPDLYSECKSLIDSQSVVAQARALQMQSRNLRSESKRSLQRSHRLLQQIKTQPWYQAHLEREHQKALLAMRLLLKKAKTLIGITQAYLDILSTLPGNFAPNAEQLRQYDQESRALLDDMKLVMNRYKVLRDQSKPVLGDIDEKFISVLEQALAELEKIRHWVVEMREVHDQKYKDQKTIDALTKKVSLTINKVLEIGM